MTPGSGLAVGCIKKALLLMARKEFSVSESAIGQYDWISG
jgi:hypothetical protein